MFLSQWGEEILESGGELVYCYSPEHTVPYVSFFDDYIVTQFNNVINSLPDQAQLMVLTRCKRTLSRCKRIL